MIMRSKSSLSADPSMKFGTNAPAIDWGTIDAKFNELKGLLNAPTFGYNSGAERVKQRQNVELALQSLLELAQSEANRLLVEGDLQGALIGGVKALELTQDFYGTNSIFLIPAYFHLAKTNQSLGKYQQAEEFLSLANWTILKNGPDVDNGIYAELHQSFGLLYTVQNKLDLAIAHLAQSVYYMSLVMGPESVITSFGYYNLGNVFAAKGKMDSANDFLCKVQEIWYRELCRSLTTPRNDDDADQRQENREEASSTTSTSANTNANTKSNLLLKKEPEIIYADTFGEQKIMDASRMLTQVLAVQMERYGENHLNTGKANLVLALFYRWIGDLTKARSFFDKAETILNNVLGINNPETSEVAHFFH
eukprot:GEZU01018331.1.p1 GENE.GEZU01018331.1~~GEZU01018331.1.p1  ORF type:complete len:365 (-),score=70.32 GEZU01018331.1:50-1144(-)